MALLVGAALIIGLAINDNAQRTLVSLVLVGNTTQPLVAGNWTDIELDRALLINTGQWRHVDGAVEVVALGSGRFRLYLGIHPLLVDNSTTDCAPVGEECTTDIECCQVDEPTLCWQSQCWPL
jgi:hypothetical protein